MNKYFDLSKLPALMPRVLSAFPVTLKIVGWALLFSLLLGFLIAAMSLSKSKVLNTIAKLYVAFMRGMPNLIMIFILYFVAPTYLEKIGIILDIKAKDNFIIATLALTISGNMAEMIRSALLAVDKGQWEAAYSVGMNFFDAFRKIVLPQALGIAIPMFGNNVIHIFKASSLAFSIGAIDLFGKAKLISASMYGLNRAELYLATAIIYWMVCIFIEQVTKLLERIYSKGRRSI